ncbi:hypothetical protein GPECTOR_56g423 [Gonium pectorale]|uniref:Pentacotripeptide-repeat region of PRORP domain-containing protein n=1 Tax=Gonium pectorale TaxID=33097 RepID=A0A150G611_GONPE|nr:hypothetical protein GPECTOR_56g423 [Gonium pectorale]|eukprot:KXZ45326.1 hypothetical protein GPECTOR_56g423 [Gonium pectorale]
MHSLLARPCRPAVHRPPAPPASASRCPGRCPLPRVQSSAVTAQRTAEDYSQLLRSCDEDWTKTLELVTEINILRVEVEPRALEYAVVSFARGGQWKRAEDLYRQLQSRGHAPSAETTTQLVAGLAGSQQGDRAAALLAEVAAATSELAALSPAYNLVVRALARQGQLDASYEMLSRLVREEARVEASTFTCVATCAMNAERTELAEEVLEMRDYL